MTKLIQVGLVLFAAYYLVKDPDGAAALVRSLFGGLEHGANSLSNFASQL